MGIDQSLNGISGRMRRGFESGQTDASALWIENAESRIVGADKGDGPFQNQ